MNLSDKSPLRPRPATSASPATSGSAGPGPVTLVPAPVPKATCAKCGRPIVLAKAPTCLYCGAPLQVAQVPQEKPGTLPPHVLLALEPRVRKKLDDRQKWLIRIGASIVGSLITGLIMGPCAKLPPAH